MPEIVQYASVCLFCLFLIARSVCAGPVPNPDNPQMSYEKRHAAEIMGRFLAAGHGQARSLAEESAKNIPKNMDNRAFEAAFQALHVNPSANSSAARTARAVLKGTPEQEYCLVISSSIPMATLRAYAEQAEQLRKKHVFVALALRGFVDGMKKARPTIFFYLRIAMKNPGEGLKRSNLRLLDFSVDPKRARRAKMVPALTDNRGCTVYGDAPLPYLLRKLRGHNCGKVYGTTYQFAEQDAIAEIKEAAGKVDWGRHMAAAKEHLYAELGQLPGENLLPPAKNNSKRTIIPIAALPFDVHDPKTGKILYPKGFQFNPLAYGPKLPIDLVVINGRRPAEIAWARKNVPATATLAVLGGNYRDLTRLLNRPVFIGTEVARKWCTATPCIIRRKNESLEIQQISLKEGKNED